MQDYSTFNWYKDPQWWIVIATFIASIVALFISILGIFQKRIIKWFYHPTITVDIKPTSPDSQKIPFIDRSTGQRLYDSYYLRFRVENTGNYHLEDIEAIVTEVFEKAANGEYREKKNFLPLNLVWAHNILVSMPLVSMPKIQTELFKHLDFGYIVKSKFARLNDFGITEGANIVFKFCFGIEPSHGSHILLPGDYNITIKFASNNLSPITKKYNLVIADVWDDDEKEMLQNNISMKEI